MQYSFSHRPPEGYKDYYELISDLKPRSIIRSRRGSADILCHRNLRRGAEKQGLQIAKGFRKADDTHLHFAGWLARIRGFR